MHLAFGRQSASARSRQVGSLPEAQRVVVLDTAVDEKGRKWAKVRTCPPDDKKDQDAAEPHADTSALSVMTIAAGWVEVNLTGGMKLLEQVQHAEAGVGEGSLSYSAVESLLGAQVRLGTHLQMHTRLRSHRYAT